MARVTLFSPVEIGRYRDLQCQKAASFQGAANSDLNFQELDTKAS